MNCLQESLIECLKSGSLYRCCRS